MTGVVARALAWVATGAVLPLLALTAGTGLLYELYAHGWLAIGFAVPGSLPLEALAGHDAQPVIRAALAWGGAGAAAGLCVAALERRRFAPGLAVFAIGAAATLVAAGALSDALSQNQPVPRHVLPQLAKPALAFAWSCETCAAAVAGAALVQVSRASAARGRR